MTGFNSTHISQKLIRGFFLSPLLMEKLEGEIKCSQRDEVTSSTCLLSVLLMRLFCLEWREGKQVRCYRTESRVGFKNIFVIIKKV